MSDRTEQLLAEILEINRRTLANQERAIARQEEAIIVQREAVARQRRVLRVLIPLFVIVFVVILVPWAMSVMLRFSQR
jgi:uncharacterized coiled-coil protein SlyX